MNRPRRLPVVIFLGVALTLTGCASLESGSLGDLLSGTESLDEQTVADGLREALTIGTQRAGDQLSAEGGFAEDPILRILIPEEVEGVTSRLRSIGLDDQVDAFETRMNRAAEAAAGEAFDVFAGVIRSLTIQDAFNVLNGPPDAATSLFKARASDELRERFLPVVENSMQEVGLYSTYENLVQRYNAIPLVRPVEFDLEMYIVDETMSGLFSTIEQEEARIRQDPVARSTALLQRVFGSLDE